MNYVPLKGLRIDVESLIKMARHILDLIDFECDDPKTSKSWMWLDRPYSGSSKRAFEPFGSKRNAGLERFSVAILFLIHFRISKSEI